jgi:hypothetical protein
MPQMPDFTPNTHVIKKLSFGVGACFRGASDSIDAVVDVNTVCSECNLVSGCPGVCLFECGGTFKQQAKQTQQFTKALYNNNQQQANTLSNNRPTGGNTTDNIRQQQQHTRPDNNNNNNRQQQSHTCRCFAST